MQIVQFNDEKKYIKDFLLLAKQLYSNDDNMEDSNSIRQFLTGNHVLSKYFTLYKFLIYDNDNKPVGRFVITEYPDDDTAYLGFYECIDNNKISEYLFEQASLFCKNKGFKKIVGPVDASFWQKYRLKINLFDRIPYTGEPYNKSYYYNQFLESGFSVAEHYTSNLYHATNENYSNEKYETRFRTFSDNGYSIESPTAENFDSVIDEVYKMIIQLYSDFPIFKFISIEDFREIYRSYKLIMNMDMTKIAYYNGKAVGFYISIPDYANKVYHADLLHLPEIMRIKKSPKRYVMLYMGVLPEHQGLGKALVYSIIKELMANKLPSIGALAKDGKITQKYVSEEATDIYEYVLLEKTLSN